MMSFYVKRSIMPGGAHKIGIGRGETPPTMIDPRWAGEWVAIWARIPPSKAEAYMANAQRMVEILNASTAGCWRCL